MCNMTPPHEDLSTLEILKRLSVPRIIASSSILLFAILVTLGKPEFLLDHFATSTGDPYAQLFTRLWIITSLAITITISVWLYLKILKRTDDDIITIQKYDDAVKRIQTHRNVCYILNVIIIVIAVLIVIGAYFVNVPLSVLNLLSGVILVFLITCFDHNLSRISGIILEKFKEIKSTKKQQIAFWSIRYRNDRDVVLKLDVPILLGVIFTWIVGYMILPSVLAGTEQIYANGFATGAIALQVIVGNIAFEIIIASQTS